MPLHEGDDGQLTSALGIPFHGIASRALLPWLERLPDGGAVWERTAHLLHHGRERGNDELTALRAEAHRRGVLSLTESCRAAQRYLEERIGEAVGDAHVELWNTKEGHTSSVWVVSIRSRDGEAVDRFVLNVARDRVASAELRKSSERLAELARRHPELPLARVLEIAEVSVGRESGELAVVVTRNELVEDSLEIHPLPPDKGGERRYAIVERFLTAEKSPAAVLAVRGRALGEAEAELVDGCIERVRATSAPDLRIELDVHEGDLVWNGREAIVVAVS